MNFRGFSVYRCSDRVLKSKGLEKVAIDSINWFVFYKTEEANWIKFYPFSENLGGGIPYVINIGSSDFKPWLDENKGFVNSVSALIDTKG